MGLFGNNNSQGGIMDVIRCDEKSYLIWKWHPTGSVLGSTNKENAIRWGSPIRVKEGSVAVFVYTGKNGFVQDYIEGPADSIVDTKNLPIIASIIGRAYNGGSPFQAEVYFINLAETIQMKFAVPYFDVFDPELHEFSVPVAIRGSIDFNINDYKTFIKKHRLDNFSLEDLQTQIKDSVIENVKNEVGNAPEKFGIPVIQIERKISDIKNEVLNLLQNKFYNDYGIHLKDINFAGLEINKDSDEYKELLSVTKDLTKETRKAKAKVSIKDMFADQKLGVFGKAASMFMNIKEDAYARRKQTQREFDKEYETELAGRVGAAGAKVISAFEKKNSATSTNNGPIIPPPIPTTSYYVALFGQTAGPYNMSTLKQMVANGNLKADSLVWTEGMENWVEANTVTALKKLFESEDQSTLPPLPPVPNN